jgi:hypothetical protein
MGLYFIENLLNLNYGGGKITYYTVISMKNYPPVSSARRMLLRPELPNCSD